MRPSRIFKVLEKSTGEECFFIKMLRYLIRKEIVNLLGKEYEVEDLPGMLRFKRKGSSTYDLAILWDSTRYARFLKQRGKGSS